MLWHANEVHAQEVHACLARAYALMRLGGACDLCLLSMCALPAGALHS